MLKPILALVGVLAVSIKPTIAETSVLNHVDLKDDLDALNRETLEQDNKDMWEDLVLGRLGKEEELNLVEEGRGLRIRRRRQPRWWNYYRRQWGRYLRRCFFLNGETPISGDTCPKQNGNYTCLLGNQRCPPLGRGPGPVFQPDLKCDCVDGTFECNDWYPCQSGCPPTNPVGRDVPCDYGSEVAADLQICNYGSESCCGETFPSFGCHCTEQGFYICFNTDACFRPNCCPERRPRNRDRVPCDPNPQFGPPSGPCHYGQERCCGQTHPRFECTCTDEGYYECSETNACLFPNCAGFCPEENPAFSTDPVQCRGSDVSCTYGEESCCGETYPSWLCICNEESGTFACRNTDACRRIC